jgi:hypothetical protein
MPIRPFDLQNKSTEIPTELDEILSNAGLNLPKAESKENSKSINRARDAFNAVGADLNAVASTVSNILSNGETDSGKLKAAELALRVHGILQEIDEKTIPQITININGSENKTLINLLIPTP